jgi:hypothetical protein
MLDKDRYLLNIYIELMLDKDRYLLNIYIELMLDKDRYLLNIPVSLKDTKCSFKVIYGKSHLSKFY